MKSLHFEFTAEPRDGNGTGQGRVHLDSDLDPFIFHRPTPVYFSQTHTRPRSTGSRFFRPRPQIRWVWRVYGSLLGSKWVLLSSKFSSHFWIYVIKNFLPNILPRFQNKWNTSLIYVRAFWDKCFTYFGTEEVYRFL